MAKARATSALTEARTAVREGRHADALEHALAEWATRPSGKLAAVIARLTERTRVELPAVRGKTAAALKAWDARAAAASVVERPALLEALADAPSGKALERLAHVARWMPDPRVDDAILGLVEAVPYRATSTKPFWTALWPLARAITDPRQLVRLERAEAAGVAVTMGDWLRTRFAALHEELAPRLSGPHDEPPILDELATLLDTRKLSLGSRNLEALLQAVYDAPDDDGPRLVYADALQERGDPRGELITLQLARGFERETLRRDVRSRERDLLDAHGKQWLGPLAAVVMAGYRFERGFLAECRVDNRHVDRLRKLEGHPMWATVHTLAGSARIGLHPVMRSLRRFDFVSYQARNHEGLPDSWRDLLLDTERPIEDLRYTGIQSERHWEDALEGNRSIRPGVQGRWVHVPLAAELDALCACTALPRLRRLVVAERPELVAARLLGAPLVRRLDALGFVFEARAQSASDRAPLRWFADALRDAPVPRLEFELDPELHPARLVLDRGERGYERVALEVGPTMRGNWSATVVDEAIRLLDALPPTVRELRITTRRNTEPTQVARLRAAAAQLGLPRCEVS